MPLLHRKPFTRTPPPADLEPTERLFYCRVTNEVFRDYDEFFERTILCNSLVWSCSFTGKSGLTYQEALESEKKVKKSLHNFPEPIAVPALYLATLASHQKLTDLCDDIYEYVKDRFFVSETVMVVRNSGARLECTILEIKAPPQQNGMTNGHDVNNDTIVISDSDDEEPTVPDSWKKIEPIDPTLFKYKVKPVVEAMYESVTVRQCQVSRKSSLFSKDRLKYFLKLHCEIQNGIVKPKSSSISKYQILEKNYFRYFPDEPPRFEPSADRKPVKKVNYMAYLDEGGDNGLTPRQSLLAAAKERERIMQHRRELRAMELEKEKIRRERADRIKSRAKERQEQIQQKEEIKKIAEVEKIKKREARESIKLERDKEREKIREEKRKYAERLKMWSKRREDMECDDLKELPAATAVKTRLPPECFGDALMVSEFLHAFGELFELKDEFPDGMSFEMLEEALVGSDPEGPLCELLFFFLSAIFQAMCEEEEEVAKDQITETEAKRLTEALGEGTDSANYACFAVASLAAAWPQLNHGCSLKKLDLDSCTLSEILRLHILSSGADSNSASAKYRYQKQGGFVATDDACMELRLNHPAILKKLTTTSVYSLSPDEKLKILHALCGKLLTLVSTRDYIEDCVEELRQAKQEFRELKAGQNRKEREEAAARIRKRKEEKLKEQELKMKDKEDKLKEDENKDVHKAAGNEEQEELQDGTVSKNTEQKEQDEGNEDEEVPPAGKKRKGMRGQNRDSLGNKEAEPVDGEEPRQKIEKRELELMEKIQQVTACTNITPLGRDRGYRRFWTFFSVPGLFVEEDYTGITEDMLQPRPASHRESEINSAVNGHDGSVQEVQEESEASKPVNKPNRWCYYSSNEQLEQLIEHLNTRGHREGTLKDTLVQEKSRICQKLSNFPAELFNISDNVSPTKDYRKPGRGRSLTTPDSTQTSGEKQLELRLCELLLDIEERIYQGSLFTVKVPDRQLWRAALEKCSYEFLDNEPKDKSLKVEENEVEEMEVDGKQSIEDGLQGMKNEDPSVPSTNASTPQPAANSVQYLARALLLIEQGVERKYLKAPLGDAEDTKKDSKSDKKKKEERKKKDDDQEKDDASESGRIQRTVLDRWRESLQSSSSLSQIFLHLSTLDRSILWSRSIQNFRCKVCRKKGDSESMLLCDGCERGHHIYCVRPKLKCIPDGDWFCPECRPRQRSRRPDRQRPSMDSDEEEESFPEEKELQGDSENDVEEEATMSEEESTKKKSKAKVRLPLKIKGGKSAGKPGPKKKYGKSPKSQQGTPKTTPPAGRGRGKKAHSAPPQEKKVGARHSMHTSQLHSEGHETSLLELVSAPGRGRGRGRGKKIKSVDNTPVGTPFAFRPFSLENAEQALKGRNEQSENFTPTRKGRGRGKKRLSEISSGDQGNRRSSGRHQGVHELSACEQLVVDLVRNDDSWPFMRLVSKYQVPDYFDIIRKPIALNIIREKVNKCEYNSATEFIEDVQLMFSNCFEYNQFNSNEAKAGLRLQSFFVNEAQKLGLEVSCSKPIIPPGPTKKSRI
ncbi:PREDICTED: bromodomain adjacent to zinc finger domain protein 1A [Nanorana parkeri]|uniref:bromodomain adjacent to zinc finger domain protein 1A n=1 Tax=Nanorana parkeri TaxID=125878 RepID=UPI000854B551|nr:PREDICTED: bromodomain adjacent to zinc finger domain protein 1A [Nanorana parkeri]